VSGKYFLVDTGAELSVFPAPKTEKRKLPAFHLYAANDTKIAAYGEEMLKLNFGLQKQYTWIFVMANVSKPILGADFLKKYGLLVDIKNSRLVDGKSFYQSKGILRKAEIHSVATKPMSGEFREMVDEFPGITELTTSRKPRKQEYKTFHYLVTEGPPVFCKAGRLPNDLELICKSKFDKMEREGECRPSKSNWSSRLHPVPKKKDGVI